MTLAPLREAKVSPEQIARGLCVGIVLLSLLLAIDPPTKRAEWLRVLWCMALYIAAFLLMIATPSFALPCVDMDTGAILDTKCAAMYEAGPASSSVSFCLDQNYKSVRCPEVYQGSPANAAQYGANSYTACDLAEFRAASKAWAEVTHPGVVYGISIAWWDRETLLYKLGIETRWRRAVEACAP